MSHRWRDIILWGLLCSSMLVGMGWLGSGFAPASPLHLPPAGEYRAMGNFFCFIAALDALLIVLLRLFLGPSEQHPHLRDHAHHHAARIVFMASVALVFSAAGAWLWFVPSEADRRWLADVSPGFGAVFALIALLSSVTIVIARSRKSVRPRPAT